MVLRLTTAPLTPVIIQQSFFQGGITPSYLPASAPMPIGAQLVAWVAAAATLQPPVAPTGFGGTGGTGFVTDTLGTASITTRLQGPVEQALGVTCVRLELPTSVVTSRAAMRMNATANGWHAAALLGRFMVGAAGGQQWARGVRLRGTVQKEVVLADDHYTVFGWWTDAQTGGLPNDALCFVADQSGDNWRCLVRGNAVTLQDVATGIDAREAHTLDLWVYTDVTGVPIADWRIDNQSVFQVIGQIPGFAANPVSMLQNVHTGAAVQKLAPSAGEVIFRICVNDTLDLWLT